jgi:hypothetical protein
VTPAELYPDDPYAKRAQFSADRKYRYTLYRAWHATRPLGAFIGANPSYADEEREDTTVTKCMRFAQRWEWGGMFMLNVRAYVSTWPEFVPPGDEGVGPHNDEIILYVVRRLLSGQNIVAAWGHLGGDHALVLARLLAECGVRLLCLGVTRANEPRHPSRIGYNSELVAWP